MNFPKDLKYTDSNEWIKIDGDIATIGITDYAQDQLSDVVFMEVVVLEGDGLEKGDTIVTVESVKAAADVYTPISGIVVAINEMLPDSPEKINTDPYGEAWMIKIELSDPSELDILMDVVAYENFVQEQE